MPVSTEAASGLLRRGLLWVAGLTTLGIAAELAMERHWTQPIQLVAWGTLAVVAVAVALLVGSPSPSRVRLVRILAVAVILSAALGIWEHVAANYDAGPLDYHFTDIWDSLSEATRWWLALTKSVGPSPPLAPAALAQAAFCVLLATLCHPTLCPDRRPLSGANQT